MNVKSSSGDISASGKTITDLTYEWADAEYKWDQDRDLKAREPFFASGQYFSVSDVEVAKQTIIKGISFQKSLLEDLNTDQESIDKAHRFGINSILPAFYTLDYATLRSLADTFFADKSDSGIFKANLFGEILANTGTTAAALLVRDLVMEKKFDNERDAARILSSVPFHVRRPNTQLVKEYEKLLSFDGGRFVNMAAPMALGHLVRITCERAGNDKNPETVRCIKEFATGYADKAMAKFNSASDRQTKAEALVALQNLRYGGLVEKLRPVIYGETGDDDAIR